MNLVHNKCERPAIERWIRSSHLCMRQKIEVNRLPLVGLMAEPFNINIGALKTIANLKKLKQNRPKSVWN